jgi:hypothetical protein
MKLNHLNFTTKWVKGILNVEADCLSRHPCAQATDGDEIDEEVNVAKINMLSLIETELTKPDSKAPQADQMATINSLQSANSTLTDERLKELKLFAEQDETYQEIKSMLQEGFPNTPKADMDQKQAPYLKVRDSLTTDDDGFLCRDDKFVVPSGLVQTYLSRLHSMHQGEAKMISRARSTLWWPWMARDISNFSKSCLPCETSKDSNPAEKLLTHEPATYPFQFLHMDIGQEQGHYYLISTDQYSGYPIISNTGKTCNTNQVISAVAEIITYFSIPETIYSDGGPQFLKNGAFDIFCKEWGIKHVLSSPYMPRSNGHAEAAVKQMKKLIRANVSTNGVLNSQSCLAGLQVFRNTARSPSGISPNELVFGHLVRDSLPVPREMLMPEFRYKVEERLFKHKQNLLPDAEKYGPKRELSLLAPKTPVRIQNPISKKWDTTGFIVKFGANTREYEVRTGHKLIRRNRHFLKEINVEAVAQEKQPAQAPDLPAKDEEEQADTRQRKISFSSPDPTVTQNEEDAADRFTAPTERRTPCPSDKTDRFPMPAEREVTESPPDKEDQEEHRTTWYQKPAQRRDITSPSDKQPTTSMTPQSQAQIQQSMPRLEKPKLAWPNNITLKPRKKPSLLDSGPDQTKIPSRLPNSFQSNNTRTNRMSRTPRPNTYWDPESNWRTPTTKPANRKERWDKDSKWTPPSKTSTTPTPRTPRTPRSTSKPIEYNDDWMDEAFSD